MSKTGTKPNEYRPTKAEKKLLEALVNPDNMGINVEDLCAVAKISKNTYYVAMKKPEFVKLVNETTLELVKGKVSDVLNASYLYALTEKGFQDRKMILTIAGIYVDKSQTELSGSVDMNERSKEIQERIKGRMKDEE